MFTDVVAHVKAPLPHQRSLTYKQELIVPVGHAESGLAVDFARGGVNIASFRERGEVGDSVRQPETLRVVKEQDPCRKKANITNAFVVF